MFAALRHSAVVVIALAVCGCATYYEPSYFPYSEHYSEHGEHYPPSYSMKHHPGAGYGSGYGADWVYHPPPSIWFADPFYSFFHSKPRY
ncbi:MAG: hypothetical protein MI723_07290, partial [Caulobacterales bacterium]|nr:hypothetical protein [Caulobacterales bacterium]